MAKLILTLDGSYLNEYSLNRPQTSIGRKSSNDIHLDNLAVSGSHALVVKQGKDFFVEDLNSTNGTRLNNITISKHVLQNEDVIELGRYRLTFLDDAASHGNAGFEKTMMVHPSVFSQQQPALPPEQSLVSTPLHSSPVQMSSSVSLPARAAAQTPHSQPLQSNIHVASKVRVPPNLAANAQTALIGKIQVLNGTSSGRELVLNKALTTLGKTGVQVAVITKRAEGYFITHVEGKVLPIINGVSAGVQARALADHDVIELAGVKMEFYLSSA